MRVAVTGAAGFIGSHAVDGLLAAGHSVTGIDDLSTGRLANLQAAQQSSRFAFVHQDITAPGLSAVMQQFAPDVVCHLAAAIDVRRSVEDPVEDARINILGTIAVLESARAAGAGQVVFVSSGGAIYGETPSDSAGATESSPLAPESPYGAGKAAAELWLAVYARLYGIRWTALALSNVYGPRQAPDGEGGVVSIFGSRALADKPVTIYGDGLQTRDFVFVGDVAAAVVAAAAAPGAGRLNIGTGLHTSVADLHTRIQRLASARRPPTFGPERAGEVRRSALDASAARAVLGWAPATDLDDGLRATLKWLASD